MGQQSTMANAQKVLQVGSLQVANNLPLVIVGGMNVLESEELAVEVATEFSRCCSKLGLGYVFKASFDPITNEWADPINLGYPINTPDDDIYFDGWPLHIH